MKKAFDIIWGGTIIVMAVIFVGFFALLFVPQMVNDMALPKFEKEVIENLTLPENSKMIEYVSGCGNTSGAGDHTELYVAILIKSSLDGEDMLSYYKNDENFLWVRGIEGWLDGRTIGMTGADLKFETETAAGDGYYILEYCKSAPLSWLDIRGM